jgi:glycosyltransferase involved in cell wall biosynthesis
MPALNRVLIFRNELLPASETFIAAQAAKMCRYDPWFAGLNCLSSGVGLDPSRITVLAGKGSLKGKIQRRIYLGTGYAPRLYRNLRGLAPALIHAHFALDGCAALPIQKKLRVPLIVTLHGYDVTCSDGFPHLKTLGKIYLARREQLWQRAHLFVCVSEHIRRAALQSGFPEHKLWVHRIGIEIHGCEPSVPHRREPVVLFVGRLVEKKGCAHLIRAMAAVQGKISDARLVIIGDGPLRVELESQARRQSPGAIFLGFQPAAEVRSWMRRARVLAAPSIVAKNGDTEGLPIVLCEAQAIGLPIVAFRGPGVAEAVIDGETAVLADPLDHDALGAAIVRLFEDTQLHARLALAGQRHAEKSFDISTQTAILENKYDEVRQSQ